MCTPITLLGHSKGEAFFMNADILKGKWRQLRGSVRSRWNKLTDDDLGRIEGDFERFIGVLQERYGYGREQAEREMNEFFESDQFRQTGIGGEEIGQSGSHRQGAVSSEQRETEGEVEKRRKIS